MSYSFRLEHGQALRWNYLTNSLICVILVNLDRWERFEFQDTLPLSIIYFKDINVSNDIEFALKNALLEAFHIFEGALFHEA